MQSSEGLVICGSHVHTKGDKQGDDVTVVVKDSSVKKGGTSGSSSVDADHVLKAVSGLKSKKYMLFYLNQNC